jgi:hypothetical protein
MLAIAALASCSTPIFRIDHPPEPGSMPPETFEMTVIEGSHQSRFGNSVDYRLFVPTIDIGRPALLLGHGFLRNADHMRGWGETFAKAGYITLTPSFAQSRPFSGNHDKNAIDLSDLAAALFPGRARIYAGFSAGGLASLIAASTDPLASAYLGLDAVDSGGLAGPACASLVAKGIPALLIVGEPSRCNAGNNILAPWLSAGLPEPIRVLGAPHTAFERPYDPSGESLCGRVEPLEALAAIIESILSLAWEFVEGVDASQ